MKKLTPEEIEQEYYILKSSYEKFLKSLLSQLENILETEEISLGFPIQSRIKDIFSLLEKIENGRFTIKKSIKEVQDIIGLRIILIFKKDVNAVSDLIRKNLTVIKEYSSEEKLLDNQFGYSSLHFIVKIPEAWRTVPTFKGLEDFFAEIQLRTLSQHTWAEASQKLQYKQEETTPGKLLRSIGRVSALLETVDLEFERLLDERENYKIEISQTSDTNQLLDVDLLQSILDEKLPKITKNGNEKYSSLVKDLKIFDINSKEDLTVLIEDYLDKAVERDKGYAKNYIESKNLNEKTRAEQGVFFNQIGLVREMLDVKFGEKWKKYNSTISEDEE
jgi:putative GTP pyrophosphokinase